VRILALIALVVFGLGLFAALALPWLLPRPGLDGQIPDQPFTDSRFAEVESVGLHYRWRAPDQPEEPLIVLLHGFGGSAFSWRDSLDVFEQAGYRTMAIDLPPFGYSQRVGGGTDWASLVTGLVDQIDPDARLIVIGHSMGAGVAARLAARQPDRIERLIMVAGTPTTGARGQGSGLRLVNRVPALGRWAEILAAHRLVNEANIRDMLASAFGRAPSEQELAGYFHPLTIPGTYPALLKQLELESEQDSAGWDQVPTRLIWGEEDGWVPLGVGQALAERYPGLQLQIMPGAGHNPMDTEAEAFNRILVDALVP
jgi:2-hydroxy-6-oxonona-2,4-dienedioate hydrolase